MLLLMQLLSQAPQQIPVAQRAKEKIVFKKQKYRYFKLPRNCSWSYTGLQFYPSFSILRKQHRPMIKPKDLWIINYYLRINDSIRKELPYNKKDEEKATKKINIALNSWKRAFEKELEALDRISKSFLESKTYDRRDLDEFGKYAEMTLKPPTVVFISSLALIAVRDIYENVEKKVGIDDMIERSILIPITKETRYKELYITTSDGVKIENITIKDTMINIYKLGELSAQLLRISIAMDTTNAIIKYSSPLSLIYRTGMLDTSYIQTPGEMEAYINFYKLGTLQYILSQYIYSKICPRIKEVNKISEDHNDEKICWGKSIHSPFKECRAINKAIKFTLRGCKNYDSEITKRLNYGGIVRIIVPSNITEINLERILYWNHGYFYNGVRPRVLGHSQPYPTSFGDKSYLVYGTRDTLNIILIRREDYEKLEELMKSYNRRLR